MKRILPLLLLCCLLLSACGGQTETANVDIAPLESKIAELEAKCAGLESANEALSARCDQLQEQLDTLEGQLEEMDTGSAGAYCNLFINNWEEDDGALVLTSALFHVQIPSDASIESTQLVLTHNGTEIARADITLESGEAQGSYQITLTDTWFLLPDLEEDDVLDLHPEVVLSSGMQLTGGTTSWFVTADGLSTVVG